MDAEETTVILLGVALFMLIVYYGLQRRYFKTSFGDRVCKRCRQRYRKLNGKQGWMPWGIFRNKKCACKYLRDVV